MNEPDVRPDEGRTTSGRDRRAAIVVVKVVHTAAWFSIEACMLRCPLTDVAQRLGADDVAVTDIYLPRWFAHYLPAIHVPLIVASAWLHARNIRSRRPDVEREMMGFPGGVVVDLAADRSGPPGVAAPEETR